MTNANDTKEDAGGSGGGDASARDDDPTNDYIEASIIIKGTKCNSCCNELELKKEAVQCCKCNHYFHANCFGDKRDICSQSALTGHFIPALSNTGSYEIRFGRFLFLCDFCSGQPTTISSLGSDINVSQDSINDKVDSLSCDFTSMKTELKNEIESLKGMLTQVLESCNTHSSNSEERTSSTEIYNETVPNDLPTSYADTVRIPQPTVEQNQQLLHISTNDVESLSPNQVKEKVVNVKEKITTSLKGIPTNFVKTNNQKGSLTVAFPDEKTREKAERVINDLNLSSDGFQSRQGQKMLPKLTVKGIESSIFDSLDSSLSNEEKRVNQKMTIVNSITSKNEVIKSLVDVGHTLEVVYLNQLNDSNKLTVALKVSPSIRTAIFKNQQGKIFIGNNSLLVEDRFFFKQCYHCQQIGHFSADCPNSGENPVCFYCMGQHLSKHCTKKRSSYDHCCAKCFNSKVPAEKADYKTHNAADPECPVILREIQKIANNTEIYSKNVM